MLCLESAAVAAASSLRIIASIEKSVGFLIALAGCCSWLAVPIIILLPVFRCRYRTYAAGETVTKNGRTDLIPGYRRRGIP